MTWYDVTHFERPDDSFPDYDRYFDEQDDLWDDDELEDEDDLYFGYDDLEDEFSLADEDDINEIVDEYCGSHATEEIVQQYLRMGEV